MGPTASGKTGVAAELAALFPAEIISCDSMQAYRGMPILTQAPLKAEQKKAVTHLVSFLDPSQEYSAAKFRELAGALVPKILKKKKTPIVCGGTGLYLRALLDGLFESPEGEKTRDLEYRDRLLAEQEEAGGDYLHAKLEKCDPAAAKKIHPNDFRRLVRALEIFHLSGKPFSSQKANREGLRDTYDVRIFLLDRDRAELYDRIERRVDRMITGGILGEVKRLRKKKLSMTAEVALGYREMSAYLDEKLTLDEAAALLKRNTRHYAKRQLSWFRHEKGVAVVPVAAGETDKKIAKKIYALWRKKA